MFRMSTFHKRMVFVWVILGIAFLGILIRLFTIQIIKGEKIAKVAEIIHTLKKTYVLPRGTIFDRNGKILAMSKKMVSVYANTDRVKREDIPKIAKLCGILPKKVSFEIESKKGFIWLRRRMPLCEAEEIRNLNIPGIGLLPEYRRFYPLGAPYGNLIGFVRFEDDATRICGLSGIEASFNKYLAGKAHKIEVERDGRGSILWTEPMFPEELKGNNLILAIDSSIQYIAHNVLKNAVAEYEAVGGTVVVIDPTTGEVLASVSYPSFDPNIYSEWNPSAWKRVPKDALRNRTVSWVFEPGSLLKPIVFAVLLQERLVKLDERFFCPGESKIGRHLISCIHPHKSQSFREVLINSCNIGMTQAIERMKNERLLEYLEQFGFGKRTGIGLKEEERGIMPKNIGEIERASLSFGYGIAVTPIQLAMAISCIANSGVLLSPILVRNIQTPTGEIVKEFYPVVKREVLSKDVAKDVANIMVDVIEEGTGREAKVAGYRIAGKTGTAEKAVSGCYDPERVIASFVGWFPVEEPSVFILVAIDEPKAIQRYGGLISAPVFAEIAERIIVLKGVERKD